MWWRESHNCYYSTIKGKKTRLDPDEKAARQIFGELLAQGEPLPDGRVADLLEAYMQWCLVNRKSTTFDLYKRTVESFGQSLPPGLLVNDVKPYHLTRWLDAKYPRQKADGSKPATDNTRHDMVSTVCRAFNWACQEGIIQHSPLAHVKKPPKTPRETYMMPAEWDTLLGHIKDQDFRDFLLIVRHTGCRPQEARAVEAKHFFPEEKCWILPKELSKGEKEERCVLLNDVAMAICTRRAADFPEGAIFRNRRGRPWTKDAVNSRFQRLKTVLPFHCSAYTCRHSFGTDALIAGVGEATVAALMGHRDKTQILKTYQHVAKRAEHLREGLKKATSDLKT
jgi:integrase